MRRMFTGLVACLAAAAIAGCGTASAVAGPGQTLAATHGVAGHPAGCLRSKTVTVAGNGKTYCIKVGDRLDVFLQGTVADMWQVPHVTGHALVGAPNGALSLVAGLTGASFRAARPGQAVITSFRAPHHHFRTVIIVLSLRTGTPAPLGRNVPW